jgi:hypothetical protein
MVVAAQNMDYHINKLKELGRACPEAVNLLITTQYKTYELMKKYSTDSLMKKKDMYDAMTALLMENEVSELCCKIKYTMALKHSNKDKFRLYARAYFFCETSKVYVQNLIKMWKLNE